MKNCGTLFLVYVDNNVFCVCSLFLKTLLRVRNCLLKFKLTKTKFPQKKCNFFSSWFTSSFFPNLSLIIVCSVVALKRTSAAGHPLHQAASCHFLSFHFIVSVFSLLSFFMIIVFVFSFKKILLCFFSILKESFPSFFLKKIFLFTLCLFDLLLLFSLSMNSSLFQLLFFIYF